MTKVKSTLLAICLVAASVSSAKAAHEKDIFFCTKDLDSLQSSPGSITGSNVNNNGNANMQTYFPLENDKHNVLNLRHCFVTFASIETKEDSILTLKQVQTYGYGANPAPEGHKKTGDAYEESGLQKKIVSCVPVLESSKLKLQGSGESIYQKWAKITEVMDKETDAANYNTIGHNCCSVAYHAVKEAEGDLSHIDSSNFNLYGMGIRWGQSIGNITDYLTVSTHNSFQFLASATFFSPSSDSNSTKENTKDLKVKTKDM